MLKKILFIFKFIVEKLKFVDPISKLIISVSTAALILLLVLYRSGDIIKIISDKENFKVTGVSILTLDRGEEDYNNENFSNTEQVESGEIKKSKSNTMILDILNKNEKNK